jgi:phosphatidylglycerophosphate synthase
VRTDAVAPGALEAAGGPGGRGLGGHSIPAVGFEEAKRELAGLTASVEKRVLLWLAARMPAWVTSDHLTALGLVATLLAGAAYALSGSDPRWLHLVNLSLVLNWFGDSLDGTLARYRGRTRPRYGFYVDHMVDAFGALFLLGGLALSGHAAPGLAAGLLIAYYLLSIHISLATYTLGTFKISYGPFGGTELRLMMMAGNLALLRWPVVPVLGRSYRLFDVLGALGILGIAAALLVYTVRSTARLYRMERV